MRRWRRTTACERAVQWVSLDLDGELDELELAALARHLERCAGCAELQAEIGGFTRLVRAAPLTAAGSQVVVIVPTARRVRLARRAAATVAVAALLSAAVAGLVVPQTAPDRTIGGLGVLTPGQRIAFVRAEHARIDARTHTLAAPLPKPPPFAARVL